jgi:hypothetical protein
MPNEFTEISVDACEKDQLICMSFCPNDYQTDLKDLELNFQTSEECWSWIDENWSNNGLDDGTGWMRIRRRLDDEGNTTIIRIAIEAINGNERNRDYFRLVTRKEEDNGSLSFIFFGQGASVGEYRRLQLRGLIRQLLVDQISTDDLYRLFEIELAR